MPRPTKKKSVVWEYFTIEHDKKMVTCNKCNKNYKFFGNTTNLKEHLKRVHPFLSLDSEISLDTNQTNAPSTPATSTTVTSTPATSTPATSTPSTSTPATSTAATSTLTTALNNDPSHYIQLPRKRSRQLRLTDAHTDRELTEYQISEIDKSLVEMIVTDYQPMSIVEDKGFTRLCKKLNPKYNLPSRKTLTTKLIPQQYSDIRSKVIEDLKQVEYISATTDYWQSQNQKSYLSLTVHYIRHFKMKSRVLEAQEVIVSHTSENTGDVIKKILDEYDIFDKIVTVVTDNAPNMKKAVSNMLHKHHHACVAHTLNLSVNEVINQSNEVSSIIAKCRSIIGHFKHSIPAANKLREKQKEMGLPELKPKQDVSTRWNSAYIMLERLLELKQPLSVALTELSSNSTPDNLSGAEWSIVSDCTMVLKSLLRVTEELSAEQYVTMSKIVPLIRGLQHKLRILPTVTQIGSELKVHLLDVVTRRLSGLEGTKLVAKATFLDPRFKKPGFGNEENANNAQQWVTEELTALISRNQENTNPNTSNNTTAAQPSLHMIDEDDPWLHFDQKAKDLASFSRPSSSAVIMVKQYVESPLLPRKEDPLLFWETHEKIFPELSKLALKYLSIPATSVPSERLFSKTGYILNARRSMLKPKKLNEIVFLNSNIMLDD